MLCDKKKDEKSVNITKQEVQEVYQDTVEVLGYQPSHESGSWAPHRATKSMQVLTIVDKKPQAAP